MAKQEHKHKIIQEVSLGGKNWGEVLAKPCVSDMTKIFAVGGVWIDCMVTLRPAMTGNGKVVFATKGDTLVEFDNHKWGARRAYSEYISGEANGPQAGDSES